jgi:hypothetical protein
MIFMTFSALMRLMKASRILKGHIIAIFIEALGTLFVFLDALRLDARSPANGFGLGDLPGYQHWYYHRGIMGFLFLFAGILSQLVLVFLQSAELENIEKRLRAVEQAIAAKEPPKDSSQGE